MRRDPLLLAIPAALLVLYSCGILGHDLWTPDEPRVAALAREVAEGAWVVPTLNGRSFLEQPPLHAWCVALVYRLLGYEPPEIGRIVSALFGLGGLAWTYLMALHLASGRRNEESARRVALLSALSLGLSLEYLHTAHRVVVDGALAFFTTGSAYAFLRALWPRGTSDEGARSLRPGIGWLLLAYVLASMAFLAKNVIGLAASGLALLAIIAVRRDLKLLLRAKLWLAPLCFAAVAGPWLILLHGELGSTGWKAIFLENTLGRVVLESGQDRGHTRPLYFYLLYLPLHFLPSTVFLAGAVLRRVRDRTSLDGAERSATDFALLWLGAGFVMLSLAATKRAVYLVPFFPAAAIACGLWLDAFLDRKVDGRYERAVPYVLAVALGLLAAAAPILAFVLDAGGLPVMVVGSLAGLTAAAGVWISALRSRRVTALVLVLVGLLVTLATALYSLVPTVDRLKSLGPVSRDIAATAPRDAPLCALDPDETTEGMISFYGRRSLTALSTKEELAARVAALGEIYLLDVAKRRGKRSEPLWRSDAFGVQASFSTQVVKEYPGAEFGTRAFRLLRVTTSAAR